MGQNVIFFLFFIARQSQAKNMYFEESTPKRQWKYARPYNGATSPGSWESRLARFRSSSGFRSPRHLECTRQNNATGGSCQFHGVSKRGSWIFKERLFLVAMANLHRYNSFIAVKPKDFLIILSFYLLVPSDVEATFFQDTQRKNKHLSPVMLVFIWKQLLLSTNKWVPSAKVSVIFQLFSHHFVLMELASSSQRVSVAVLRKYLKEKF